jgi:hypothetical protein
MHTLAMDVLPNDFFIANREACLWLGQRVQLLQSDMEKLAQRPNLAAGFQAHIELMTTTIKSAESGIKEQIMPPIPSGALGWLRRKAWLCAAVSRREKVWKHFQRLESDLRIAMLQMGSRLPIEMQLHRHVAADHKALDRGDLKEYLSRHQTQQGPAEGEHTELIVGLLDQSEERQTAVGNRIEAMERSLQVSNQQNQQLQQTLQALVQQMALQRQQQHAASASPAGAMSAPPPALCRLQFPSVPFKSLVVDVSPRSGNTRSGHFGNGVSGDAQWKKSGQ